LPGVVEIMYSWASKASERARPSQNRLQLGRGGMATTAVELSGGSQERIHGGA
jgi:hypothetical protein